MNPVLQEFYAQDASLKQMNTSDQIRLFEEWAKKKNINWRLRFKRRIESKLICYGFTAVSSLIVFLELSSNGNNIYAALWTLFFFWVYKSHPELNELDQGGVINSESLRSST